MSERKVLNKYYPPDYDPSRIPRCKNKRSTTFAIRIMAPFNMRCNNCGEYIYKGKKFNSRKEDVDDDAYLGLKIFRFYIKCPRCVSEIAFKTDLVNTDYTLEAGATRNFEAAKTAEKMALDELKRKEEEELNNPMKVLENRTKASQREIEELDTLEELKDLSTQHASVSLDEMLKQHADHQKKVLQLQEDEDEAYIRSIFGKDKETVIKRLPDPVSDKTEPCIKKLKPSTSKPVTNTVEHGSTKHGKFSAQSSLAAFIKIKPQSKGS